MAERARRYDRQLRLWGAHGQQAMEDTSICLLNATATGTETLKNLVLPGIGSFTVVDGAVVTLADTGNNFFVHDSMVGSPRAACVTQLLQELNEHVNGSYVNEDISRMYPQVLEARPDFLCSFGLVVATQLGSSQLKQVSAICEAHSIPLLVVHSYGFLGYLRLSLNEHHVVETHPDHPVPDLRVLAPPAALNQLIAERFADLSSLPSIEYAHVPFLVLLVKAVAEWRQYNANALPTQFKQKKEVRAIIERLRRADMQADLNIEEALAAVNTALSLPTPSASTAAILTTATSRVSELAAELQRDASSRGADVSLGKLAASKPQLSFWLTAAAVAAFVDCEGGGALPVVGTLPDMTCDTETYVQLQNIYLQQAQADAVAVHAHVREIASLQGLPSDLVTLDYVKLFCKNSQTMQVLTFHSISSEFGSNEVNVPNLTASLSDDASGGSLYLLLRAALAFRGERSRWPGTDDSEVSTDVPILKGCVQELAKELGLSGGVCPVSDELIHEFCRWGGGEMHAIASVMGGVAAQEVIKAVTRQYVTLNNTLIFNGSLGTTSTLQL